MHLHDLFAHDSDTQVVHLAGEGFVERILLPAELVSGSICFVKNTKFLKTLETHLAMHPALGAGMVIDRKMWEGLDPGVQTEWQTRLSCIATSSNVPLTMAKLSKPLFLKKFAELQNAVDGRQMGNTDIHPSAIIAQGVFIGEQVKIGANVILHPGCVISSQVEIGDGSELFANVVVYSFTKIGKQVRVHANTTIGSDGFGYVFDKGIHHKIWHTGGVNIGDQVEIGANCSIDMGTFTPTVIGSGVRIDNQVQIAHNCKIGTGCVLCGQSGMAGSAVLEDYVVLGGRVAIGPDALIGKGSQVAGGAMVNESAIWPAGSVLGGHPARDLKEWMRTVAWVRKSALKT